jgi:cytochrome c biogenesis protein CcmG/thiol:disulfide interchange protein DsbE
VSNVRSGFYVPQPTVIRPARRGLVALIALALAVALVALAGLPPQARADGDPGSDVLVYQPLFVGSDAGVSVPHQVALSNMLRASARRGAPIRVAIIASPFDLGAVTALWRKPQDYARFLGTELSLAYKGELLVVMPNGFGVNWPGHSSSAAVRSLSGVAIGGGGAGLAAAAETATQKLSAASGVQLTAPKPSGGSNPNQPSTGTPVSTSPAGSGSSTDAMVAFVTVGALLVLGLLLLAARRRTWRTPARALLTRARARLRGRTGRGPVPEPALGVRHLNLSASASATVTSKPPVGVSTAQPAGLPRTPIPTRIWWRLALLAGLGFLVLVAVFVLTRGSTTNSSPNPLATNPYLDPGTSVSGAAPDFTLANQFGQDVSLHSFRGKVTILAFNDSQCTTICPLTTTAMLNAKRMLGPAAGQVQLLGVDSNPKATSVDDVLSYTQVHGLVGQWQYLTGSLPQLKAVWRAYGIQAEIERGLIEHTPALYVIDQRGRMRKLYMTQQSYAAVGQFAQILAREVSGLLPGHPPVASKLSYQPVAAIPPTRSISLPAAGGGRVALGPGRPHLYVFFDTWDREVTSIAGQLNRLNDYAAGAGKAGLPPLTAVDEGSVEPSPSALPSFLKQLPRPLRYPVAIDTTGRVGDGYEVQGEPWLVLTSATGKIVWYQAVDTSGWPSAGTLRRQVHAALARAPQPRAAQTATQQLIGSPAPLASLHAQASSLIGSEPQLMARIKALRGYPIVINAWASWCGPCKAEFALFASASVQYGRQVAFLGADTDDSAGDAGAFLAAHRVSYPSYSDTSSGLQALLRSGVEGLPTTIFIDRNGKVAYVHTGQYAVQGTLDEDIKTHALGAG